LGGNGSLFRGVGNNQRKEGQVNKGCPLRGKGKGILKKKRGYVSKEDQCGEKKREMIRRKRSEDNPLLLGDGA